MLSWSDDYNCEDGQNVQCCVHDDDGTDDDDDDNDGDDDYDNCTTNLEHQDEDLCSFFHHPFFLKKVQIIEGEKILFSDNIILFNEHII